MKKYLLLLALVVLILSPSVWQAQATASSEMRSPTLDWDVRLDGLNVSRQLAADCSGGCWRLVSAKYEDKSESGGLHHIWAKVRDQNGAEQEGLPWTVAWSGGNQSLLTKPVGEWADFAMFGPDGCYSPNQGESGGHRAYAGNNEAQSDTVHGMGLPYCWHVNFKLTWQWDAGGQTATPTQTATQLPSETATQTPLPGTTQTPLPDSTPAITATPNANLIVRLWLPLVLRQEAAELPTPTATATAGGSEPTVTPSSSASFDGEILETSHNCELTQLIGMVHDSNGQPLLNTRIRIIKQDNQIEYTTAGSYIRPETDNSGWSFELAFQPIAYTWRIAIVDDNNLPRSSDFYITTDSACNEGAANVVKVRFFVTALPATPTATEVSPSATAPTATTTASATATATATATNIPPSPTATEVGMPFGGEIVQTFVNCGLTQVFGVVHNATGQPQPGTRVRLTWDNGESFYATAGDYVRPETDASGWEFFLDTALVANTWRVAIIDQSGALLSEEVYVQTDSHCNSGAANVVKVRFMGTQ